MLDPTKYENVMFMLEMVKSMYCTHIHICIYSYIHKCNCIKKIFGTFNENIKITGYVAKISSNSIL